MAAQRFDVITQLDERTSSKVPHWIVATSGSKVQITHIQTTGIEKISVENVVTVAGQLEKRHSIAYAVRAYLSDGQGWVTLATCHNQRTSKSLLGKINSLLPGAQIVVTEWEEVEGSDFEED